METNQYSWNQTLKFSWGHIIAFVALIFISYVMYMGDFYQNGGDFVSAAVKVGIIDFLLLVTFIGAQIIKGTDEKFNRSIIIERILICCCPLAFIFAMFSYNHFWSVFDQRLQIETHFNSSIEGAKQMFIAYDKYAADRITTYGKNLDAILRTKTNDAISNSKKNGTASKVKTNSLYKDAGFTGFNDYLKKQNYIQTLNLQLRSQNTDSLKFVAMEWINEANQGASVWNAFLVGNVEQIDEAIKSWNKTLKSFSEARMSNETIRGNFVVSFDYDGKIIKNATNGINSLKNIYNKRTGLKFQTLWTGLILFLMLLFPYFLQRRNTRAEGLYFLIPGFKLKSISKIEKPKKENKDDDVIYVPNSKPINKNDNPYDGTF